MIKKIGIYAGAFDPVHMGHIAFAKKAAASLDLEEVVFLPEQLPRGKPNVIPVSHRLALLGRVLRQEPKCRALLLDTPRFSVQQTLPELQRRFVGSELVLLLGSDVVRTFSSGWPGLPVLLRATTLAVGVREGDSPQLLHGLLQELEKTYQLRIRYQLVVAGCADVSSSMVRQRLNSAHFIHPAAEDYIKQHGLYKI